MKQRGMKIDDTRWLVGSGGRESCVSGAGHKSQGATAPGLGLRMVAEPTGAAGERLSRVRLARDGVTVK